MGEGRGTPDASPPPLLGGQSPRGSLASPGDGDGARAGSPARGPQGDHFFLFLFFINNYCHSRGTLTPPEGDL